MQNFYSDVASVPAVECPPDLTEAALPQSVAQIESTVKQFASLNRPPIVRLPPQKTLLLAQLLKNTFIPVLSDQLIDLLSNAFTFFVNGFLPLVLDNRK
jgi:hypothetical protein